MPDNDIPVAAPAAPAPAPAAPDTASSRSADSASAPRAPRARVRILAASIALLGVLLLSMPLARWWFAAGTERAEITRYVQAVETSDPMDLAARLRAAEDYNRTRATGRIADPFAGTDALGQPVAAGDMDHYRSLLALDSTGVMASIAIPSIDVVLPVHHGSSEHTLKAGIGHIYGSSLPVGGQGTHSVLVGHSGHGHSRLFNALPKVREGDVFTVTTLGRELHYRVTSTEVVEPSAVASLHVVEGRDLITLVTCTPTGINSHRLLVHAERTDAPADAPALADSLSRPFPWWALVDGAALVAWAGYSVWAIRQRR